MSDDSNNVSSLFEGTPEFEGEPPIPPEHDDDFYNSEMVIGWLNSVAKGHDRYFCLSHVFSSAVLHSRRAGRKGDDKGYLTPNQRDRVINAARAARWANPCMFWEDTPVTRQITRHGFDTLEKIIELWTYDLFRLGPSDDERLDIYAYARIFQNLMHNICLAEEIEERMKERAAKDVANLRSIALGSASTPELAT